MFPTTETLPFWDTFEVLFFTFTGLFSGVVLGILFPSIWRSLRRFFRQYKGYAHIPPDTKEGQKDSGVEPLGVSPIQEAFVKARWFAQNHQARKAIHVYVAILTNEKTSRNETNLALLELSQAYLFLGLKEKAFETAYELLKRKPRHSEVVETVLLPCVCEPLDIRKLNHVLETQKGYLKGPSSQRVAHALCQAGRQATNSQKEKNLKKSLGLAKKAQKIDPSSLRVKLDIWEYTSLELWHSGHMDPRLMWLTFMHDMEALIEILEPKNLSPAPAAGHLAWCFWQLAQTPWSTLTSLQEELVEKLKPLTDNPKTKEILRWCLVFALKEETSPKHILHQCQNCHTMEEEFYWRCLRCGAYESYQVYGRHEATTN